ncbi:unnamed protein product, partial [Meganyctiphanes norvegica]
MEGEQYHNYTNQSQEDLSYYDHNNGVQDIPVDDCADEVDGGLRRAKTDAHLSRRNPAALQRHKSFHGAEHYGTYRNEELQSQHAHNYGPGNRESEWFNTIIRHRRHGKTPATDAEVVQEIAQAMEHDQKLMADDIDGEVNRREALRELPKSLKMKKQIRNQLTVTRERKRKSKNISSFQQFKYLISVYWHKFGQSVKSTMHDYSLWHKDLKEIEGVFGTGIGSYFRFLRYLLLLNIGIACILCGFLLVPQLLYRSKCTIDTPTTTSAVTTTTSAVTTEATLDRNARNPAGLAAAALHLNENLALDGGSWGSSMILNNDSDSSSANDDQEFVYKTPTDTRVLNTDECPQYSNFGPLNWLTGVGWFNTTELYYGGYNDTTGDNILDYNIAAAYFFVIFSCFIIYLVAILHRVIQLYKVNYIDATQEMSGNFVKLVFCAWDFNISNQKGANIRHKSIYNQLSELLCEQQIEEEEMSLVQRVMSFGWKATCWLVLLTLLGLIGWFMQWLVTKSLSNKIEGSLLVYPLIVTAIMLVVPMAFEFIVRLEHYKNPRHNLYATLIRTILLELVILGVLIGSSVWKSSSHDSSSLTKSIKTAMAAKESANNAIRSANLNEVADSPDCWETELGGQIYRLLIIEFLVQFIFYLPWEALKAMLVKRKLLPESFLEFNISRNTLQLIYNQTLLWFGLFYIPLAPLIVIVKMILLFYMQKIALLKFQRPAESPWRAAQTETLFFALTLLALILAFMAYGYVMVKGNVSNDCGPFVGYTHYIDLVWKLSGDNLILLIVSWFLKPGIVAGILGLLVIVVYCARSMSEGRAEMIELLQRQLDLEVQDRAFLLKLTEKLTKTENQGGNNGFVQSHPSPISSPHKLTKRASFTYTSNREEYEGAEVIQIQKLST